MFKRMTGENEKYVSLDRGLSTIVYAETRLYEIKGATNDRKLFNT